MFNKKILFFAIFFVSLLAFSTVSAADNLTDDMVNSEEITDTQLEMNENSDIVSVDEDNSELSVTQEDILSASKGTFNELSKLIEKTGEKKVLKLKKDYKYDSSFSKNGITIGKSITIDGNGHTIDCNNLARAFYISANDVTLKNIIFKNGRLTDTYSVYGGSIYWRGYNGLLTNCKFINSKTVTLNGDSYGGAVYWSADDGKITNCAFYDCYSSYNKQSDYYTYSRGGAVYWYGSNGVMSGSTFGHCIAESTYSSYGGAVYWNGYSGILQNSQFNNCFATSTKNSGNGAAVYWYGNSGLIDNSRFIGNSKNEYGVVYINGDYMEVQSSTFVDNAVTCLYWKGSDGEVHNSILYSKTSYVPVYSSKYYVNANYNWWGNTILDYNVKKYSPSNVGIYNWLYVTVTTNKNSLSVGESANVNINLNNLYSSGTTSTYTNSKLGLVTFTVTDESFTNYFTVNKGFGTYRYKAKSVPMDPVIVQFDTHVTILKYNVKKVSSKIISPTVKTVYNSGKFLKITLKDKYNNRVSGTIVGVSLNGKNLLLTTKNGQVKVSLKGFKPKKYTAKIRFAGDKNYFSSSASAKIIIKKATPKLKIIKTFTKKSKKKIVKITVKDGVGPIKKMKVSLKFKGKTYKSKTNSKGIVKFDLTKKLKKIGKYNAKVKVAKTKVYKPINKKIKITVKKSKK